MISADTLVTGFVFGLANAAHCAGMCGVFAFHAGTGSASPLRMPLYFLGKTSTYVFLGTLAGLAGSRLVLGAGGIQAVLGVFVGAVLLLAGWRLLRPAKGPGKIATAWARLVEPLFRGARHAHETGGPFALGAVTGALPCGVSYLAALQAAAVGSAAGGAMLMAAFGAGTIPVLLLVAVAGRGALMRFGPARLRTIGAVVVLATGLVAIARSAPTLFAEPGAPACCKD